MKTPVVWRVYVLKHPITHEIRYVGWTSRTLKERLKAHIQHAVTTKRGAHKNRWVLSLRMAGLKPEIEEVESGEGDGWKTAEPRWIRFYRGQGLELLNRSDGGEGNPGYVFTDEIRQKISQKNKGRPLSPEHKAKLVEAGRKAAIGRPWTPEHKAKESERLKGKPRPAEFTAAMHAASRGRIVSAEIRQQISARRKGAKASPETRAKMSASHQNRSAEIIELQVAALRRMTPEQRSAAAKKAAISRWGNWQKENRDAA